MMPAMIASSASRPPFRRAGRPIPARPAFRFLGGAVLALLALGQIGCGGNCAEDRQRTRESLEKARAAHADVYAPDAYKRAADLADQADAECRKQEDKLLSLRSARSRELHREARQEVEKAVREGTENEGIARQEALNARYLAIQSVEDARGSLARARKEKGEVAVGDLVDFLANLRRALVEMQGRIDRKEYLPARDLGTRIVENSVRLRAAANRRVLGLPSPSDGMDRLY